MGADLVMTCVVIPKGKDMNELQADLIAKVNAIDVDSQHENVFNFFDMSTGESEDDVEDMTDVEVRTHFVNCVNNFFKCINGRDVTYIEHKKDFIYITGGMSFGDSPTDAYEVFEHFITLCDIFNLM